MLANRPRQFQLSLAVSELVRYSSCHVHVTIRHKYCKINRIKCQTEDVCFIL
jgi:hypothetical protein